MAHDFLNWLACLNGRDWVLLAYVVGYAVEFAAVLHNVLDDDVRRELRRRVGAVADLPPAFANACIAFAVVVTPLSWPVKWCCRIASKGARWAADRLQAWVDSGDLPPRPASPPDPTSPAPSNPHRDEQTEARR